MRAHKHIITVLAVISLVLMHAGNPIMAAETEDVSSTCSEEYSLDYYFSAPLSLVDMEHMSVCVLQDTKRIMRDIYERYGANDIDAVIERIKASESHFTQAEITQENTMFIALLQNAQLLSFLYITEAEENKAVQSLLANIQKMSLAYLTQHRDREVQIALACLVSFAISFHPEELYTSLMLSKDLASRTEIKQANAKSALVLGIHYAGAIQGQTMSFNQEFSERYFLSAIEQDEEQSYVSYLSYIYLANLYFKTHNIDKMKQYISYARAMYPEGFFAYIVEQNFFAQGDFLF